MTTTAKAVMDEDWLPYVVVSDISEFSRHGFCVLGMAPKIMPPSKASWETWNVVITVVGELQNFRQCGRYGSGPFRTPPRGAAETNFELVPSAANGFQENNFSNKERPDFLGQDRLRIVHYRLRMCQHDVHHVQKQNTKPKQKTKSGDY